MKIGVPKEIKRHEYRVGLTPQCVRTYVSHGHQVYVQANSGAGTNAGDALYKESGAEIVNTAQEVFERAEMIVKVKEPQPEEYGYFREGHVLFTYLHLAADRELTEFLMERKVNAVAYETIELADRTLPCLRPMSEIAGRLSTQEGAKYLEKPFGGRGVLLGGVPGVPRGKVAIIGGGTVGTNACKIACGMGADVTILDLDARRLEYLDDIFGSRITTLYSNESNLLACLREADLVIGAVLIPGESAPRLIKREHLGLMKEGAVFVDVAIDQGGIAETSKATTHDDPVYIVDNIVHYCVANMPGAVANTSTNALTSVTLPYGLKIADHGLEEALKDEPALQKGLNTYNGSCVHPAVARSCEVPYTEYTP